jgi:hypothetical protein
MAISQGKQIKSIQRGVLTIPNGSATATATIAQVDPQKSTLTFAGWDTIETGSQQGTMSVALENATTVRGEKYAAGSTTLTATYQVVEYY